MSTKGIVDIVFCIDASNSMQPCIDAVRSHAIDFIRGVESNPQLKTDWRIDFLAYSCDEGGNLFPMRSLRLAGVELLDALYRKHSKQEFFTTSIDEFRKGLEAVEVIGDEATLIALDTALDFPWRPSRKCHRAIICLTDEPLETNAALPLQQEKLPALLEKIQQLGVMLFLVGPASPGFDQLAEVDKSEVQVVDVVGNGLRTVQFNKVLSYIGKSLSVAGHQTEREQHVQRALFGQDTWVKSFGDVRGR